MNPVLSMAVKDIRVLFRDKLGAFFIIGFPICMGLFFGLIMNPSSSSGSGKIAIAVVDQDNTDTSRKFIESLQENDSVELTVENLKSAKNSVRRGKRVALLVLEEGFGETAGVFWEPPPTIQLGVDPSRTAESGMLQGLIMEAIGQLSSQRFQDSDKMRDYLKRSRQSITKDEEISAADRLLMNSFFSSVEGMIGSIESLQNDSEEPAARSGMSDGFQFANIKTIDVSRKIDPRSATGQLLKLRSRWDISFPQAMMWGVMSCVAGFAISIARERSRGTMLRLQIAPLSRSQILAGKALACFLTVILVIAFMTILGLFLGMKPNHFGLLAIAAFCVAYCFVGIMMVMSVLGKTEASVNGAGWAINMVMAMVGGAMIPVMFMPAFIKQFSVVSPIKWSILSIEGAIWREFSLAEMLLPCGILLAFGTAGLLVGALIISKDSN